MFVNKKTILLFPTINEPILRCYKIHCCADERAEFSSYKIEGVAYSPNFGAIGREMGCSHGAVLKFLCRYKGSKSSEIASRSGKANRITGYVAAYKQ